MVPSPAGPVNVGTTTREQLRVAGKTWHTSGEVTEVEPGRRVGWRTTSGAAASGSRSVEPIDASRCRARRTLRRVLMRIDF
jgi:hypothetical protein